MSMSLLDRYFEIARHWGSKINITANLEVENYQRENVLDPTLALQAWQKSAGYLSPDSLADLGCGGGFVGITWHILLEQNCQTLLVDADRKKIGFCKQVIRELGLRNISAKQIRLDPYHPQNPFGKNFAAVVSRATWDAEIFFRIAQPLLIAGGRAIAFQSSKQWMSAKNDESTEKDLWLMYDLPGGGRRFLRIR